MSTSWQIIGQQAKTHLAGQDGHIDFGRPEQGFYLNGLHQGPLQMLCLRGTNSSLASPATAYVRQDDLVINYGGDRVLPFHLQVYWGRRSYPASAVWNALEWTLAMQTNSLLDPSKLTATTTGSGATQILQLPADEATIPEPINSTSFLGPAESTGCILVRMGEMSYIELIHPQDFISLEVIYPAGKSEFSLRRSVFDCTLEKGVILRARLLGLCVPRSDDVALLRSAYRALLERALPLTA